jgi:hypothetical protein
MVVGDGAERVVVAVALRHGTVDVSIRADDHHLAQALASTRDELDGALGRHGLSLGDHATGDGNGARDPRSSSTAAHHAHGSSSSPGDDDATLTLDPASPAHHRDPHLRARA